MCVNDFISFLRQIKRRTYDFDTVAVDKHRTFSQSCSDFAPVRSKVTIQRVFWTRSERIVG